MQNYSNLLIKKDIISIMKMKTEGIIGGLGPETTAKFYLKVIAEAKIIDPHIRPPMIIWNVPIDLATEESFIKGNNESQTYIQLLADAALRLEKAGADFIVIPCNTVHVFIEEIRHAVQIPVLSIVEETKLFLKKHNISKVGLLATSTTINHKLYNNLLEKNGIEVFTPTDKEQSRINLSITRLVNNEYSDQDREIIQNIIISLSNKGVQTTLLACTDFQLVAPSHPTVAIYDTMLLLAQKTAKNIFEAW